MRIALARLAQANIPKLQQWLDAIEDPAKQFSLFLDLCEYHLPRLARTELTGPDGGPMQVKVVSFSNPAQQLDSTGLSDARLAGPRTGLPPRGLVPSPKGRQG